MKKVLVLEDQNYTQVMLERVLRKEFNLKVENAENGIIGIEKYKKDKPDLIFLDISMPEMNGLEFLSYLRSNIGDKTIPVVVLTANNNKYLIQQLIKLGITDYLLKPFTYDVLKERVEEILHKLNVEVKVA